MPHSTSDKRGYKVYTALLNQSGTDAPVATVLENTLGDIVWTYDNVGIYIGTLTGAFLVNKTTFTIGTATDGDVGTHYTVNTYVTNVNEIGVFTFSTGATVADSLLLNTPIEIRVYN